MLSFALIGCFKVQLISVTHRKGTQGKYIFQYFLALGNYTVNKMRASYINMLFYFHFRDRTNSVQAASPKPPN